MVTESFFGFPGSDRDYNDKQQTGSTMKMEKQQKRIVMDRLYGVSGFALCICLILLAGIPVVSAYDQNTSKYVLEAGYNPNEFTIQYFGYAAVQGADIPTESQALLDKFYDKYHDSLPSRWGGREEPASGQTPIAYIFRVLPDGSTISYFDYGEQDEDLVGIYHRALEWKQTTLVNATKDSLKAQTSDPSLIGQSNEVFSFKPYGQFSIMSLYYWDNKDSSNLEQIFIKNSPKIVPGDYLHNHNEGEFGAGWFADQLIYKQYLDQTTGTYKNLPSATIVIYDPTASHTGPYTVTVSVKDSLEVAISLPFTLFSGDTNSAGSSGNSWVNWEEHFQSFPSNSQGAKEGNILTSTMLITATKDSARNGKTYVITKNVIYPNKAFKNGIGYKPDNQNNAEKYMTAKWYNGGWTPSE